PHSLKFFSTKCYYRSINSRRPLTSSTAYVIMSNSSEAIELWAAFKKGDRQAFNGLVTIFYESLYRYGARLSADHRMVEDCLQDLFLDLWRRREFIAETEHVKFYLLKALRRKIYSEKKTR